MSWNIQRIERIQQPRSNILPDWANPMNAGLVRMWNATSGLELVDLVNADAATYAGSPVLRGTSGGMSVDLTTSSTNKITPNNSLGRVTTGQITVAALIIPNVLTRGDPISVWNTGSSAGDQYVLMYGLSSGKPQFFISNGSGSANSGTGPATMVVGGLYMIVGRFTTNGVTNETRVFMNGVQQANAGSGGTVLNTNPTTPISIGNNFQGNGYFNGKFIWGAVWNRPLTVVEIQVLGMNPWQLYKPARRRLLFAPAQVVTDMTGGGAMNLMALTEQSTGIEGVVGSGAETLMALTESATGIEGVSGFGRETLKALLQSAFGKEGAVGFGTETLKAITVAATGTVQSNNVTGGGTLTLKALLQSGTGLEGVVGSARDNLLGIKVQATGKEGAVGSMLANLKPITMTGFGESGATPTPPAAPSQGGAPAWWGYEGFDGTARPWWYKDLKDKACELERLRQQRIEIGLLPPDKVEETVEEVLEFVEEIPTPATADYYIARYEALSERIERFIDNMMEEDDEQAVMEMSKFFFPRKEQVWQTH